MVGVSPSDDSELPHHAVILMLEDVAEVHDGHVGRRQVIEPDQDLRVLIHEDHILPARFVGSRLSVIALWTLTRPEGSSYAGCRKLGR